jgi:uncharacterized membrane protein required for colicin V production
MAMLRNTVLLGVALYLSRYGPIRGVGVFIAVFLSGWLLSFFYGVYLYPRVFSRLRHLPGPKVIRGNLSLAAVANYHLLEWSRYTRIWLG